MIEPPPSPTKPHRFLHSGLGRVIIGLILVGAIQTILILMITIQYQREQRIAKTYEALGVDIRYGFCGPTWIPEELGEVLPFSQRVVSISLDEVDESAPPGMIRDLGAFHNLELLTLNGTQITDAVWKQLNTLPNLKNLWLRGPTVTNLELSNFTGLTKLKELHLYGTEVDDTALEHIKGLMNLEWLDLRQAKVTGSGLKHFKGFDKLRVLDLSSTKINDAGLEHLKHFTSLERLCLDWTTVTDAGLEHLKGMTRLRRISFYNHTRTTPEGRKMLRKSLPGCIINPNP
jgi:Leucine-rich repeat (LRR) protein